MLVVPLVPKVAALYTVKGVVEPDPLPKVLLPAKKLPLRSLRSRAHGRFGTFLEAEASKHKRLLKTHLWL